MFRTTLQRQMFAIRTARELLKSCAPEFNAQLTISPPPISNYLRGRSMAYKGVWQLALKMNSGKSGGRQGRTLCDCDLWRTGDFDPAEIAAGHLQFDARRHAGRGAP